MARSVLSRDCPVFDLGRVRLQRGGTADLGLAYKTYGTLGKGRDNVVVLPTFYTGDHLRSEQLFGAGRAIDPARHFVVSVNLLGNGISSSPSNSPAPHDGPRFPNITFHDNVRFQHRLLTEKWGVRRVALVAGWSMAGCQAYEWAAQFPAMVRAILPYCASAKTSIHNIVFLEGVKAALTADAAFELGHYTAAPERGLRAFGRVYAGWAYSQAFFREHLYRELGFASFEELLGDWERDHLDWDANDLLAMLWTWQQGDISANDRYGGNIAKALSAIEARAILLPCNQDLYFPPEDNAFEAKHMPNAVLRPFDSAWGHSAGSPGRVSEFTRLFDQCAAELLAA
ncbi:MAG TPA: alpha/beta fold hydrolase [Aestuariivirgaceae bacterium]|nr:alpha/beta fold hydrolase [Aestuariivirgaceae bacterium]